MAVGDTENDMAIVKAAHIGVAMGNATDELKAQADYVTNTNENGTVSKKCICCFCRREVDKGICLYLTFFHICIDRVAVLSLICHIDTCYDLSIRLLLHKSGDYLTLSLIHI